MDPAKIEYLWDTDNDDYSVMKTQRLLCNWDMNNCIQDTHFDAYKNTVSNSIRLFSGQRLALWQMSFKV